MSRLFIFADEAGCFTFNRNQNVSKYFILCTVVLEDCRVGTDLLDLRRQLAWDGQHELGDYFHASTDKQSVRDEVYKVIAKHDFSIQATIMEKSKGQPQVVATKPTFYKYGFYFHFKFGVTSQIRGKPEALVTTASLGQKKEKASFQSAVGDVMWQTKAVKEWKADFMPCQADPCLQVADYCAWAIQRKWESAGKDVRSYNLISPKITYEFDLWAKGTTHYY
jgi:hypothetical protein